MGSFLEAGDEDDAAFLSAIAEAEADGMRRLSQEGDSRRKQERHHAEPAASSLPSSHGAGYGDFGHGYGDDGYSYRDKEAAPKRSRVEPEGEYMAALRGTHSETWQAMSSKARVDAKPRYGAASSYSRSTNLGFDGGGSSGRATMTPSPWGQDGSNIPGQAQVPQRNCPCGGGTCLVLTANTEKNPGRQFYRCPLRKEEGQCGFFEWCDGITGSSQGLSKEQGSSYMHSEFPCPCGEGPCITLTAKTEKNMGRQFYRCPLNQGEGSCGFFKWCDESAPALGATAPAYGGRGFGERAPMSNVATGQGYKRGMDGQWAKDASPKGYAGTMRTGQAESGTARTCYKCNQAGHWANNCPNQQFSHGSKGAVGGFNRQGSENNFSRGFPNASGYGSLGTGRDVGTVRSASYGGHSQGAFGQASLSGRSGGSGSCYKCGGQGHYANECRGDGKG